MGTRVAFALLFLLKGGVAAQSDLKTTLLGMYAKTLDGMQRATV